jgi:hypothetical protein
MDGGTLQGKRGDGRIHTCCLVGCKEGLRVLPAARVTAVTSHQGVGWLTRHKDRPPRNPSAPDPATVTPSTDRSLHQAFCT